MLSKTLILSSVVLLIHFIACQTANVTTTTTTEPSKTSSTTTPKPTITTTTPTKLADTCTLNRSSKIEKNLLSTVLKIDKKQFTVEDKDHIYYFGVCTKAENADNVDEAFIQMNKKSKTKYVLGRLNDVDLEGFGTSSKGIRIQYKNGDNYGHVCNKAKRNAVVYFICNPNNATDVFELIEENHDREGKGNDNCAYVFQLSTPLMCSGKETPKTTTKTPATSRQITSTNPTTPNTTPKKGWGLISIIFFITLGVLFVYFIVGSIYMRYVRQARGIEQLPHHEVWQAIGAKSADCCNYICRCGKVPSEIRNYEHISDRLSDDDENLLNM